MVLAAAMSIALSVGISVRLKKCEVAGAQEIVDYGDNYSYFMFYSLSLFGRSASLSNLHVQRSTVFFKILFFIIFVHYTMFGMCDVHMPVVSTSQPCIH